MSVIDLNKIIPPWDYLKIIKGMCGQAKLGIFRVDPEIKFFRGDLKVPLNFPYQCTFEQMKSGSILRDFDRSEGIFFVEEKIVPGVPEFGWIYEIKQLLLVSKSCR